MGINWDKLDKEINFDGIEEKINKAGEAGDFPEIPNGQYEVKITEMELGKSKKKDDGSGDDPMVKIQFEIVDGEFKTYKLFYNGVIQAWNEKAIGFQIHNNNEMLRKIWDADEEEVQFKNFKSYAKLIDDIADEVITDNWEYIIKKGKNKGGYDTYEIVEVLD